MCALATLLHKVFYFQTQRAAASGVVTLMRGLSIAATSSRIVPYLLTAPRGEVHVLGNYTCSSCCKQQRAEVTAPFVGCSP